MEKLIKSFLEYPNTSSLIELYKVHPTKENKELIEISFQKYVRTIQLISYFAKVLKFESQHYDMKLRKNRTKDVLASSSEASNIDYFDSLAFKEIDMHDETTSTMFEKKSTLHDIVSNPKLHSIIMKLKEEQQMILYYLYIEDWEEKQIAEFLGITKQAVNKKKKKILTFLKEQYVKEESGK